MNVYKKLFLLLSLISPIYLNNIKCEEDDFEIFFDDDNELDNLDDSILRQAPHVVECETSKDILGKLTAFSFSELLEQDFYLRTNVLNDRSVNTLPVFNLYHTDHICQDWLVRASLFWNYTNKVYFTTNSSKFSSYLALQQETLIRLLDDIITTIDVPRTLSLLNRAFIEERKTGAMFQILKNFGKGSLELRVPLYYLERNYQFFEPDQIALQNALAISETGAVINLPRGSLEKHAVSDRFGFGDLGLKWGYLLINNENLCTKLGLQLTLPTAIAFKKGIIGSDFQDDLSNRPSISLQEIFNLAFCGQSTEAIEKMATLGFQAIDWLSAMVLDQDLGRKNLGIGVFIEPKFNVAKSVTIKSIASFEYFIPNQKTRFFILRKNPALFDESIYLRIVDSGTEQEANDALNFFNEQIIETLFPNAVLTPVSPGFTFQFNVAPDFNFNEWSLSFGLDFWYQQKERFNRTDLNPLFKIDEAIKSHAYQTKLFGSMCYTSLQKCYDWRLSVNADQTIGSVGIGKDYTVSLGLELNF